MGTARKVAALATLAALAPGAALAAPAPQVSNLLMSSTLVARQGHARFLAGIRTATEARVIARILIPRTGEVVKTVKTPGRHARGRAWLLVDATNSRGFQLAAGRYLVQVYAVDAARRRSNVITRGLRLTVKPPRGVLHAYTVPAWPSIVQGVAAAPGGQIVAAVGPGSAVARAGLQRGDVIRVVNGFPVDARGAWFAAMRQLPAGVASAIDVDRAGVRQTIPYNAPPDWTPPPSYASELTAAVRAAPGVRAYAYAAARERLDSGATAAAKSLYAGWSATERNTAPGEFLSGAIMAAEGNPVAALGAYNRALVADPTMSSAQFSRGLAWTAHQRNDRAIEAFQLARALDPTDAIAATFHAYALLRADQFDAALVAADAALALDHRYEEARIARGLALIGLKQTAAGIAELKRGLTLLGDPARAQQIITANLEPNTP